MAKQTARDRLWTYAIKRTHRDGGVITAADLSTMAETSERSARDVLKTMEENGVLTSEKRGRIVRYRGEWEEL